MFDRQRHIKSTAFERSPDGFVYYDAAWSMGVPVSAEEREIYLSGAHIDWLDTIYGRAAVIPRRPYWRTVGRMLGAVLLGFDPAEATGSPDNPTA